ncbi:hypothetical protein [Agathobaculum desmolans]|uniref:hypothetical protein n=1 Tax=Agathobaculum desmolans TaxID=39484 RepID=UPI00248DA34E|nr:hypothetical protein [Agathobaculum desmolans]
MIKYLINLVVPNTVHTADGEYDRGIEFHALEDDGSLDVTYASKEETDAYLKTHDIAFLLRFIEQEKLIPSMCQLVSRKEFVERFHDGKGFYTSYLEGWQNIVIPKKAQKHVYDIRDILKARKK